MKPQINLSLSCINVVHLYFIMSLASLPTLWKSNTKYQLLFQCCCIVLKWKWSQPSSIALFLPSTNANFHSQLKVNYSSLESSPDVKDSSTENANAAIVIFGHISRLAYNAANCKLNISEGELVYLIIYRTDVPEQNNTEADVWKPNLTYFLNIL